MLSDKYEWNWNKLFMTLEWDILEIIEDLCNCGIGFANPFYTKIGEWVYEDKFPSFISIINQRFNTDYSLDYDNFFIWDLEKTIVKKDMFRYFENKDLSDSIDYNLFRIYFDNPEIELKAHFLDVLKNGEFAYMTGGIDKEDTRPVFTVIQSNQNVDGLNTTIIIKGDKIGCDYELVSMFPSISLLGSKQQVYKGMICYQSAELGFFEWEENPKKETLIGLDFTNFLEPIQYYDFYEGHTNTYCFYGFAFNKKKPIDSSLYNFEAASFNSVENIKLKFENYETFEYNNIKFYKLWQYADDFELIKYPIFISEKVLPSKKIKDGDEIEMQVIVCGQIQP